MCDRKQFLAINMDTCEMRARPDTNGEIVKSLSRWRADEQDIRASPTRSIAAPSEPPSGESANMCALSRQDSHNRSRWSSVTFCRPMVNRSRNQIHALLRTTGCGAADRNAHDIQ